MLASCQDDDLSKAGLELAVNLLRRGNRDVQNTMMQALTATGRRAADIRPFDGTEGSLVLSLRQRLRLAVKEIRERKTHLEVQAEKRAALEEIKDTLR